jgi:hypothetical protein
MLHRIVRAYVTVGQIITIQVKKKGGRDVTVTIHPHLSRGGRNITGCSD